MHFLLGGKMSVKNVIDMTARRKKQIKGDNEKLGADGQAQVFDITDQRQEIITEERRKAKRTILSEFIGAYAVIPQMGLVEIELYDISVDGLSFDLSTSHGHFRDGEEIALRLYLTKDSYLPFSVKVRYVREINDERTNRHGTEFVRSEYNEEAIQLFVQFMEKASTTLCHDNGDIVVRKL